MRVLRLLQLYQFKHRNPYYYFAKIAPAHTACYGINTLLLREKHRLMTLAGNPVIQHVKCVKTAGEKIPTCWYFLWQRSRLPVKFLVLAVGSIIKLRKDGNYLSGACEAYTYCIYREGKLFHLHLSKIRMIRVNNKFLPLRMNKHIHIFKRNRSY